MNNKAFLLVSLLLVINVFSCKKTKNIDYKKWENLNTKIISSYIENICLERASRINFVNNYLEISGSKIKNEENFDRFISSYLEKIKDRKFCNNQFLKDSIFNKKNITFFKPQYLVKKNYINLLNDTDCIKNIQKELTGKKLEKKDKSKSYSFGKVLFTKNYDYGFVKYSSPHSFGYMIFKRKDKTYYLFKHCQLGVF